MRSTLVITSNTAINNLSKAYNRLSKIENQTASGQRVNKASDDPLAAIDGLRLSSVVARIEQYNRNIQYTGYSFLNLSESILSNISTLMNNAKSVAIAGASDATTSSMRQASAVNISSIMAEIVAKANAQEAGRYLFGGTQTTTSPYQLVGGSYVYYRGNDQNVNIQVDAASTMAINSTGESVFGSMSSVLDTGDMNPCLNLGGAYATKLSDLNNGQGIPKGSINIKMGSLTRFYPNGITIDLSACNTLEDVAKKIEATTLKAAQDLDPKGQWGGTSDGFLTQRYVKVDLNDAGNGLKLYETDPVWESIQRNPNTRPSTYPAFENDREAYLTIAEVGGGSVASSLGINNSVRYQVDPLNSGLAIPSSIIGRDLDPRVNKLTLLADLANYSDKSFTITNGALPGKVGVLEINDTANNYDSWYLSGLDKGKNTDKNGELYVRLEEVVAGSGQYRLNVYKSQNYTKDALVAQGDYKAGLITLTEINNSGVNGTVKMPPVANPGAVPPLILQGQFDPSFNAVISLSSYKYETVNESSYNVIEEFRLRGMFPGSDPHSKSNEPCNYDGRFFMDIVDMSANPGIDPPELQVNVYNSQSNPRVLIATGSLDAGLEKGVITLSGIGNFSDLEGSVYVDWNRNLLTPPAVVPENPIQYNMQATFATVEDLLNAVENSGTYTSARISHDGKGVEIVSQLAGAYLMVTEQLRHAQHYNDYGQLGEINLTTLMKGYNTDEQGRIFANIITEKETAIPGSNNPAVLPTWQFYTTSVKMYNRDPQSNDYDDEKSLVGETKVQLAYDTAANTWHQYEPITDTWSINVNFPADTTLNIVPTNNSGLTGTIELNQIRLPQPPALSTQYYNINAPAGKKDLGNAIVINTSSGQFTDVVSNNGNMPPDIFSYLESTSLNGVLTGVNTDADGNIQVTTGYRVMGDNDSQLCNLQLSGVAVANTDALGKIHAVTSYAIENDGLGAVVPQQIHQLNLTSVTQNFTTPRLSDCSPDGKIYVDITGVLGAEVEFYNDALRTQLVGVGTLAGNTITINPIAVVGLGVTTLRGSFQVDVPLQVDINNIEIDLRRSSVMLYNNNAPIIPANLVAAGNSDTNGVVNIQPVGIHTLSGTMNFPVYDGRQYPKYDNTIEIDTTRQEAILYAGADYTRRVAKGEITNQAGGEVKLIALNNSGLTGTIMLNSVVDSTDDYKQIQKLNLKNLVIGVDTDVRGCVYAEVIQNPIGVWTVNFYNNPLGGAGNLIADGIMDTATGSVNIMNFAVPRTSIGSLQLANPPTWMPTDQLAGVLGDLITIDVSNQHQTTITPPTGLKNSGQKREENVFTTLNDVLVALSNNDVEWLHDLLDKFDIDNTRFLTARANIGTRVDRLQMLEERHIDEIFNFTKLHAGAIALDYKVAAVEWQNAQNIFQAALQTTAKIIPMSLVNFL